MGKKGWGSGAREVVGRSFSRASRSYDAYASVQTEVGMVLLEGLPPRSFRSILELGCGTGWMVREMANRWPEASIIGSDISLEMLLRARDKVKREKSLFVVQDGGGPFSFAPAAFDLLVTSGMFQWLAWMHGREKALSSLAEWAHLIKAGGVLGLASFGPGTLFELQKAVARVLGRDPALPVSRFLGHAEVLREAESCFRILFNREKCFVREYSSLLELLRTLKATGVAPPSSNPLLRSRSGLEQVEKYYRSVFGSIVATYRVFFIIGEKR